MKCPYCQSLIDDDSRWCDQCGKELMFCPACRVPRKGNSCPRCGELLVKGSEFFKDGLPALVLSGNGMRLGVREGAFGRKGGIFPELSSCSYISGTHGELKFSAAQNSWSIRDCGSTNGTFINGTRLEKDKWYVLKAGCRLRIATLDFIVEQP